GRASLRCRGAGRSAIARLGIALVAGARQARPHAIARAVARVVVGAGVGVVAGRACLGRRRAGRRTVAGLGVALVAGGGDGGPAPADARAVARLSVGAGVPVVASLGRLRSRGAARGPVTRLGVALVTGAGDRSPAADAAAGTH